MATTPEHDQRADDARAAIAIRDRIVADLDAVLLRYEMPGGVGGPVFARYLVLTALTEILGHRLNAAIVDDAERARPWAQQTIQRLDLFLSTSGQRPQ